MRNIAFTENSYYHIYNRGNLKQTIFHEPSDYARFLFGLLYFQSDVTISNTNRYMTNFLTNKKFTLNADMVEEIVHTRTVELINFCLMPNHFHATVRATSKDSIPNYMHRVSNAYAKYYTMKHETSGHVFQGRYKAKEILTDTQLCYLSAYIHRNPYELPTWKYKLEKYYWSSLQDYKHNRWGEILNPDLVLRQFRDYHDYSNYCKESAAKISIV